MKDCITMVNEKAFEGNGSRFETYEKDPAVHNAWATEKITHKTITARSHGFRYRGQYEDELTEAARVRTRARQGAAREWRDRWKSSRAGWRERGCGSRWSR